MPIPSPNFTSPLKCQGAFSIYAAFLFWRYRLIPAKHAVVTSYRSLCSDLTILAACFIGSIFHLTDISYFVLQPAYLFPPGLFFLLVLHLSLEDAQLTRKARIAAYSLPYVWFFLALSAVNQFSTLNGQNMGGFPCPSDTLLLFFAEFTGFACGTLWLAPRYPRLRRYERPCLIAFLSCGGPCFLAALILDNNTNIPSSPFYLWFFTDYLGLQFYIAN